MFWLMLVIICYSGLSLAMKAGSTKGHSPLALITMLFVSSAVLLVLYLFLAGKGFSLSLNMVLVAVFGGATSAFGYFLFVRAMGLGNYGLTNAIMPMSFMLPVVYSAVVWDVRLGITAFSGITLIIAGFFLISAGSKNDKATGNNRLKWLIIMLFALLFNGAALITEAVFARSTENGSLLQFVTATYCGGGAVFACALLLKREKAKPGALVYGLLGNIGSVGGFICTLVALNALNEGVVFPVSLSGTVFFGALLSQFLFKEKINFTGYAGIIAGIAGIILIAVK